MAEIILASGSAARRNMLVQAGLSFDVIPAAIDEATTVTMMRNAGQAPAVIAARLAEEKARIVAAKNPWALVIGADQILYEGDTLYMKAETEDEALANLKALRGKPHRLVSAACVMRDGDVLWSHADEAVLYMKDMDDDALARYAARAGDALTSCVGCYELEGAGAWLFDRVEGDYFTVLGLPLLPLLSFLQNEGYGP